MVGCPSDSLASCYQALYMYVVCYYPRSAC